MIEIKHILSTMTNLHVLAENIHILIAKEDFISMLGKTDQILSINSGIQFYIIIFEEFPQTKNFQIFS